MKFEHIKLTPMMEEAIDVGREYAATYGYGAVESAHVLAALMKSFGSVATTILISGNVSPEDMLNDIDDLSSHIKAKRSEIRLSPRLEDLLVEAAELSEFNGKKEVGTAYFLYIVLQHEETIAAQLLTMQNVNLKKMAKEVEVRAKIRVPAKKRAISPMGKGGQNNNQPLSKTPTLDSVASDLTVEARRGALDPMIGRETEIERIVHILSRRTKNNPVLVGEPGVGKSAIIEGLALRVAAGLVPKNLQKVRIMALNMANVVAGTKFRGEFEDRMTAIIDEVSAEPNTVLFIDELHTIIGAGGGMDSANDASNIMKPALARGNFQLIGATTYNEYQKYIEKDEALERRFAKVSVDEPSESEAVEILKGLSGKFEEFHAVKFDENVLERAVSLAVRYMPSRRLPDKAIDLLDEAAAGAKIQVKNNRSKKVELENLYKQKENELAKDLLSDDFEQAHKDELDLQKLRKKLQNHIDVDSDKPLVTEDLLYKVVSNLTGVPVQQMTKTEIDRLINLETELHKRVVGQEEAISAVSRAIRRSRSGVSDDRRPMGSFMFLGPTGVGKTELAKALAESVFGSEDSLIRMDMSEFMEKFSASRLIGAPPGYVGYEEGGQLTERVRNKPYSVVLFDEVEKAHPDIFNVMLQILDDGFVTDTKGRKVDFRNTIIIMTSNLGATALRDEKTVGFGAKSSNQDYQAMKSRILEELKRQYRPEFLNRIDETIVFHPLDEKEIEQIVKIMSKSLIKRLASQNIKLKLTTSAVKRIAEIGFDPEYGARPLRKAIQREIEDLLSEQLLTGEISSGQTISIGSTQKKIKITHMN